MPDSPLFEDNGFYLRRLLEVGVIPPFTEGANFMYKANVSGKDVFFNILRRSNIRTRAYATLKFYLADMLDGVDQGVRRNNRKFRTEHGGMANPPTTEEQQHLVSYCGEEFLNWFEADNDGKRKIMDTFPSWFFVHKGIQIERGWEGEELKEAHEQRMHHDTPFHEQRLAVFC